MKEYFKELLSIFNELEVEYLLVGGHAVMYYTVPRFTKDHDVWVRPTPENAGRVFAALAQFGAPLHDIRQEDFARPGTVFQMGVTFERIDVITTATGLDFESAWANRETLEFEGILIPLLGLKDLIQNKASSGRPQDLRDLEELRKLIN